MLVVVSMHTVGDGGCVLVVVIVAEYQCIRWASGGWLLVVVIVAEYRCC